jgi:hypothetical protein
LLQSTASYLSPPYQPKEGNEKQQHEENEHRVIIIKQCKMNGKLWLKGEKREKSTNAIQGHFYHQVCSQLTTYNQDESEFKKCLLRVV